MAQLVAAMISKSAIEAAVLPIVDSIHAAAPVVSFSRQEGVLLLLIARCEFSAAEKKAFQALIARKLNWEWLLTMAEQHGLEPLLFHHLCVAEYEITADRVTKRLREKCRVIAMRNLLLSAKLVEVSAYLAKREIEHIAYKGPLLAEIYGDKGALRTYRDLDLLIPEQKIEAVRDALREIGFSDRYGFTEDQQAASFRSGFEHSFTSSAGIDLDVHWRFGQEFKSSALDMDGVWARRTKASLFGKDLPALSHEDLLVVLCLHAGHHGWMQLLHMCDLAQLFRMHGKFDWEIVRGHLGDSNTRRVVCTSLYLLERHWGIALPAEVMTLISSDRYIERLAQRIENDIWQSDKPTLTTSSLRWLLERSTGEDWHDRLHLLAGSIFTPAIEDVALFPLPRALSCLYSGLRILRLAGRYLLSLVKASGQRSRASLKNVA